MTVQRMHHTLAQPPPFEMDLVDVDRAVGWIRGNVIGFRGFGDATEAIHAAWIAHRTLARRFARTHGLRLVPIDTEPLAVRRSDGGGPDVILASNRPFAELVRPGSQGGVTDSYGFELSVPVPVTELELRAVAYLVYRTLRKSGVSWALWRSKTPDRVLSARVLEPVKERRPSVWTLAREALERLRQRLRLTMGAPRGPSPLDGIRHTVFK